MAARALRVLALAVKHFEEGMDTLSDEELESGYTFIGLVGMIDPPRSEVADAIRRARLAGIRTVMLTGDQLNTGQAIARELGLGAAEPRALHARDLIGADQGRLAELARTTDVFARVSPEDKLRIVEALQKAGEVVAVTGDGVNDAPALKRANIGIAMGLRGTEVAKEAADVVLADDNFASIVRAVEGGRVKRIRTEPHERVLRELVDAARILDVMLREPAAKGLMSAEDYRSYLSGAWLGVDEKTAAARAVLSAREEAQWTV